MPLSTSLGARLAPMRRHLVTAVAAGLGLLTGVGLTLLYRDPHTATAEQLRGTATWSNAEARIFAFEPDGEARAVDADTLYYVISDKLNYPSCLAGRPGDPIRNDRRRVEIDAIHQGFDGPQRSNFAVSVHCLN